MDKYLNKRFDKLLVLKVIKRDSGSRPTYLCQCDCGNTTTKRPDYLNSGRVMSCGCVHKKTLPESPERRRKQTVARYFSKIKYKYGLTKDQYNQLLIDQDNKCKICKQEEDKKSIYGETQPLSVDHCHVSGKVRGLLCNRCNNLLARAKDSILILEAAIKYIEGQKQGPI